MIPSTAIVPTPVRVPRGVPEAVAQGAGFGCRREFMGSRTKHPAPSQTLGAGVVVGLATSGSLGTVCKVLVGASVVAGLLDAVIQVYLITVFDPSGSLAGISETAGNAYSASGVLAGIQFVLLIGAGVSFIALLWRMVRNGAILTPGKAKRKTHWAITGWFVPFLNLVRPYDMVKQAWATTPVRGGGPIFEEPPSYFKAWWWFFIASGFADRIVARLQINGTTTMRQLSNEAIWTLVAQTLTVNAGIACILVLRALTTRQDSAIRSVWEANTQAIAEGMANQAPRPSTDNDLHPSPPGPTYPAS